MNTVARLVAPAVLALLLTGCATHNHQQARPGATAPVADRGHRRRPAGRRPSSRRRTMTKGRPTLVGRPFVRSPPAGTGSDHPVPDRSTARSREIVRSLAEC